MGLALSRLYSIYSWPHLLNSSEFILVTYSPQTCWTLWAFHSFSEFPQNDDSPFFTSYIQSSKSLTWAVGGITVRHYHIIFVFRFTSGGRGNLNQVATCMKITLPPLLFPWWLPFFFFPPFFMCLVCLFSSAEIPWWMDWMGTTWLLFWLPLMAEIITLSACFQESSTHRASYRRFDFPKGATVAPGDFSLAHKLESF